MYIAQTRAQTHQYIGDYKQINKQKKKKTKKKKKTIAPAITDVQM